MVNVSLLSYDRNPEQCRTYPCLVTLKSLSCNYNSQEGVEARRYVIQCVLEKMRKCIKKSVNYEQVKELT